MYQEANVVDVAAKFFRSRRFLVLTEGANQGSGFRYRTAQGWKAPDLVVHRGCTTLVCEAKLNPADLFRSTSSVSDYEALKGLLTSAEGALAVKAEARRRISALGHQAPLNLLVGGMLLAGRSFNSAQLALINGSPLIGIVVDPGLAVISTWHNWRPALKARR